MIQFLNGCQSFEGAVIKTALQTAEKGADSRHFPTLFVDSSLSEALFNLGMKYGRLKLNRMK